MGSRTSFGTAFIISVSVMPGATALTRIPMGPSSRARETVSPFTANLDAGYAKPLGWPEILTMEGGEDDARSLATMHSAAARGGVEHPFDVQVHHPCQKVSSVYSMKGCSPTPALFTRISMHP